jgi:hypothetical protein
VVGGPGRGMVAPEECAHERWRGAFLAACIAAGDIPFQRSDHFATFGLSLSAALAEASVASNPEHPTASTRRPDHAHMGFLTDD